MKGWTKILSFDNQYQAELSRQVLDNAGIPAVVVNARDSLFLIGAVDLYVHNEDEKRALVILEQFEGLTKINSFILKKPIVNFQNYLKSKGIETVVKERDSEKYILENYEQYIENDKLDEVLPYLTGEKITDYQEVVSVDTVRQARYRVELLDYYKVDSFIIKKKDSDFHLDGIKIYVQNEKYEEAKNILNELKNWIKIRTYDSFNTAERKEDLLGKNGIRAIIKEKEGQSELYVLTTQKDDAEFILKAGSEWLELQRFRTFVEAEAALMILQQAGIDASILTIKDSMFLIGGYALYVEKKDLQKAIEILGEAKGGKIIE